MTKKEFIESMDLIESLAYSINEYNDDMVLDPEINLSEEDHDLLNEIWLFADNIIGDAIKLRRRVMERK